MHRELIALSLAMTVTAPTIGAQSLTGAAVGFGRVSLPAAVSRGDPLMAASPADPMVPRDAELPPPPTARRSTLPKFLLLGASVGMLAGGIYGLFAAANCADCFPGTQVLFIPYGMMAGGVIGAGVGGVGWVISRPFAGRGSRLR
jgi:hypothetical protein